MATVQGQVGIVDMEMEVMEDLVVQAILALTDLEEVMVEEGEDMEVGATMEVMEVDMVVVDMVVWVLMPMALVLGEDMEAALVMALVGDMAAT